MIKKLLLFSQAFFLLLFLKPAQAQNSDITVMLHESTINKLFTAIGEIKGSNDYKIGFISGKYFWNLMSPKIELLQDSARFITKAAVKVGSFEYEDEVIGKVAIAYNEKSNQISVKVLDAVFELYTHVLGKKIHLKNIQVADYLKDPFLFEGPMTMNSEMSFMMPDSSVKTLLARPSKCRLQIRNHQVIVLSELEILDKKKSSIKINQATKK